jgi:hypothetical protein
VEAPRLIVAAGRIPAEWRRLFSDAEVFRSVHHLLTGSSSARPMSAPVRRQQPLIERRPDFGEELL